MVSFDLWFESFIFAAVYGVIVMVPCVMVGLIGKKMIDKLGRYPTKSPAIQMSIFLQLIVIEIIAFFCLIAFYHVFAGLRTS